MNNNDLIRREDVKAKKVYCRERHEYVVPVAEIDWLSPVEQPMSAVEYLKARERMCAERLSNYGCNGCPLLQYKGCDCETTEANRPDEAVASVQKWAQEHPEEGEG